MFDVDDIYKYGYGYPGEYLEGYDAYGYGYGVGYGSDDGDGVGFFYV